MVSIPDANRRGLISRIFCKIAVCKYVQSFLVQLALVVRIKEALCGLELRTQRVILSLKN